MATIKEALKCALLAALVLAVAFGIRIEIAAEKATAAAPELLDARLAAIGSAANEDLVSEIDKQAAELRKQINALTALASLRSQQSLDLADKHATATEAVIDSQLAALNTTLSQNAAPYASLPPLLEKQLTQLNATLATSAQPIRETAQQLDDAAPLFLDCDHNPDCFFNRYQGVSKSIEKVGESSQGIAADVKREADQLTKPQTFWGQLKSWVPHAGKDLRSDMNWQPVLSFLAQHKESVGLFALAMAVTMRPHLPWPFVLLEPLEWLYEWLRDGLLTFVSLRGPAHSETKCRKESRHQSRQGREGQDCRLVFDPDDGINGGNATTGENKRMKTYTGRHIAVLSLVLCAGMLSAQTTPAPLAPAPPNVVSTVQTIFGVSLPADMPTSYIATGAGYHAGQPTGWINAGKLIGPGLYLAGAVDLQQGVTSTRAGLEQTIYGNTTKGIYFALKADGGGSFASSGTSGSYGVGGSFAFRLPTASKNLHLVLSAQLVGSDVQTFLATPTASGSIGRLVSTGTFRIGLLRANPAQ